MCKLILMDTKKVELLSSFSFFVSLLSITSHPHFTELNTMYRNCPSVTACLMCSFLKEKKNLVMLTVIFYYF